MLKQQQFGTTLHKQNVVFNAIDSINKIDKIAIEILALKKVNYERLTMVVPTAVLVVLLFATPAMAQMGDFYKLPPEQDTVEPNMAVQGEAVSRQAVENMNLVSSTMERCTTHIYALNYLMMAKCLEFMKNWNATVTEFNHNNSMTMIEIMLGQVSDDQ